jgi:hypothetical protein
VSIIGQAWGAQRSLRVPRPRRVIFGTHGSLQERKSSCDGCHELAALGTKLISTRQQLETRRDTHQSSTKPLLEDYRSTNAARNGCSNYCPAIRLTQRNQACAHCTSASKIIPSPPARPREFPHSRRRDRVGTYTNEARDIQQCDESLDRDRKTHARVHGQNESLRMGPAGWHAMSPSHFALAI